MFGKINIYILFLRAYVVCGFDVVVNIARFCRRGFVLLAFVTARFCYCALLSARFCLARFGYGAHKIIWSQTTSIKID